MTISATEQDEIDRIVNVFQNAKRGSLTPSASDDIVESCARLVQGSADLRPFLESTKGSASAQALLLWSAPGSSFTLADSPWSRLANRLGELSN